VAAQFTKSGNLDLVFADWLVGRVVILLGNGDGTFQPPRGFQATNPVSIAAGDFNEDGNEDLAVVEDNGQGKLAKAAKFKIPQQPIGIAAGDLNGDHHPDLAVTQVGNGSVAVFLNDGTGKFKKPVSYNAGGGEVADVKIAALRNKGREDLVIANGSQGMVVLLNKGDGTFGKASVYTPTFQNWQAPNACTVADFNLDGKLDVACVSNINDPYFFYGNGDGTFMSGIKIKAAINHQGGYGIASGDFDHDQAPDLAIAIQNDGKVAILLNTK
jgi:hypothetical protein